MKSSKSDEHDAIYGFDDTDMLEITGNFTAAYDSSANTVAFNVDSTANAITLKDFTATSLNINGDNYTISNRKKNDSLFGAPVTISFTTTRARYSTRWER